MDIVEADSNSGVHNQVQQGFNKARRVGRTRRAAAGRALSEGSEANLEPLPLTFTEKAVDYVHRHVSHSVGGSILFLGYAMSQTGVALFTILLGAEILFNGYSLTILQEMIKDHGRRYRGQTGIDRNNYFLAIERQLGKWMGNLVLIIFIMDVFCCSTFYYKISQTLLERLLLSPESGTLIERTGSTILALTLTTLFLIGTEYGEKYILSNSGTENPIHIRHDISATSIRKVVIKGEKTYCAGPNERQINMHAVEDEMSNFDRKRLVLLLLFVLLFFSTICVSYEANILWLEKGNLSIPTTECPGLIHMRTWFNVGFYQIIASVSIILYCLKTYAVLIPIVHCDMFSRHVRTCDSDNFKYMTCFLGLAFMVIYFTFPMAVFSTFGVSTPPLFVEAYGNNTVGTILMTLALAITATAMLLRIIAVFKLVHVLVTDINTEDVFWLVVVISVFISLLLSMVIKDVMYIVIFAGSVTSNLLMNIIPAAGYIRFKLRAEGLQTSHIWAFIDISVHVVLMVAGPIAMLLHESEKNGRAGCAAIHRVFSET